MISSNGVREFLDTELPQRWIGRASAGNLQLLAWPPCSLDLTPCDFYLRGYIKDTVYTPPIPHNIADLKGHIIAAVTDIDADTLGRVWTGLDYRLDVCRVTNGSHIEHL